MVKTRKKNIVIIRDEIMANADNNSTVDKSDKSFNPEKIPSNCAVNRKITVAITGASGSIYTQVLIQFLLKNPCTIYLIATKTGKKVLNYELSSTQNLGSLKRIFAGHLNDLEKAKLRIYDIDDLFAPIASGTSAADTMIILPCSMGTISKIAYGYSSNLLERAADVMIKEQKKLLVCPRETPLSLLHLQNMTKLALVRAHIVPLMPAMYQKPKTIEEITYYSIGKICELIGFQHQFYSPWNYRRS